MARRVFYEFDKDANFEEITDRVRLYTLDVGQNSEEGSVAISQLSVDDPDGDYDIVGWRVMRVSEDTAAASNTLVYYGWVADKTVSRKMFPTGAGRVWDVSLADQNTVIEMRVMNGSDANRPAETDIQRLQWLLSTNEMSRVTVSEFLNTSSPKAMDAVDYRGQRVRDIIDDCAQASGKNYFIYLKDTTTTVSTSKLGIGTAFFYDFNDSTVHSSILRLTNVASEVDNLNTFAIAQDTRLVRDPSRVYSGAYVRYDGGTVYEENFTISNQFTRRDAVYDASNVKSSAKATARALRYLTTTDSEEDRIETAFWCPAAKVAYIRPGMRVQFKAQHLPGYAATYVWLRVLKYQVQEVSESQSGAGTGYLVSLTLATGPTSPLVGAGCSTTGGSLTVHTKSEPAFPNRLWTIYTGSTFPTMTIKADSIPGGNKTVSIAAGECCVFLRGSAFGDTSGGVPFDGITWTPTGGSSTYYPENGDGNGGHFFEYDIAIPNDFTADISHWAFPEYQRVVPGTIGGVADYGLGLNNSVAFRLP